MNRIRRLTWILLLVTGLAACGETTVSDTPAPTEVESATTPPTLAGTTVLSTPVSPTDTPTPAPTLPPSPTAPAQPTPTPAPSPTLRPAPEELGFHPVDFGGFPVQALWVAPDGHLWVDSDAGLWEYTAEQIFRARTRTLDVRIVAADGGGRIWALFDDGQSIAYHLSGTDWAAYRPGEGWEEATDVEFGGSIAIDRQGTVWLALGRAGLRRLDPHTDRWQTLRAADAGFQAPMSDYEEVAYDGRLAFTDVVVDGNGNVWVSACAVHLADDGPALRQGQGARRLDGSAWMGSPEITDRCVTDMEVDRRGRIWFAGPPNDLRAGEDDFVRYDPGSGSWDFLPVPETGNLYGDRPRFVRAITLDADGRAWLFVARRGGASFPPDGVVYQEGNQWIQFLEILPGSLAFGPQGSIWVWIGPDTLPQPAPVGLARYRNGEWQGLEYPWTSPVQEMAVDGNGRLWFYRDEDRWTLWYYDVPW